MITERKVNEGNIIVSFKYTRLTNLYESRIRQSTVKSITMTMSIIVDFAELRFCCVHCANSSVSYSRSGEQFVDSRD